MPFTPTTLSPVAISLSTTGGAVAPFVCQMTLNELIKFMGLRNVQTTSGVYTPNNDLFALKRFTAGEVCNFIFLKVDGSANFTFLDAHQALLNQLPVNKIFMATLGADANAPNYLALDGRLVAANPMAQGVPVAYTLITATATIA